MLARLAALLLLFAAGLAPLRAGVADAPGATLEVALVTYGPGATYWERFGHDAISLTDTRSGESVNYNYGVFDFNEEHFFLNFARGRMRYLMDAEPARAEEAWYRDEGRSVTRQRLALSPEQAAALRDFLLWNLRPENAAYAYDYYADNCTTRVRDALDHALGGVLAARLKTEPGTLSYRQQTVRLMRAQPALMLVLDLGLGPYADQPLDAWRASFLPGVLKTAVAGTRVDGANGTPQPLVAEETLVAPSRLAPPPDTVPDLRPPLALAGLVFALALAGSRRRWPTLFALMASTWLLAAGLVGLVLLGLWTLTTHHSAWANANLLLFHPLAWLLLPATWRTRHDRAPGRLADATTVLALLAAVLAPLLHLLPGTVQQNQPWILFALPIWLALAWSLRQKRRR